MQANKCFTISFYLILAFVLLVRVDAWAMSGSEAKGDKLMDRLHFFAATEAYHQALEHEDSDQIKIKLAICYTKLNDPENTVKWYGKVIENGGDVTPEDKYRYAEALTEMGNFNKAKAWFEIYSEEVPDDARARKYIAQFSDIGSLYKDSSLYILKKATFSSSFSDFSPAYYKNNIVFVSSRGQKSSNYKWDNSSFLDLYVSYQNSLGIFSQASQFQKGVNTKFHEGPVVFYQDGSKMVLTRNNMDNGKLRKSSQGVTKLKLYFTSFGKEGSWTEAAPFIYNNDEYSVGHPAISEDGNTLYFASDMPGGYGGTDIYVTEMEGQEWGKPRNLGPTINTQGNEMFPFLHENKTIFFASNGHGGMGGLDIFKYDLEDSEMDHFGYPINSTKDDFGFIVGQEGNQGFLSSNRNTENGTDNIYQFEYVVPNEMDILVKVVDIQLGNPIPNASISVDIFGSSSDLKLKTDGNGEVLIPMELRHQYHVKANKNGYDENAQYIIPKDGSERLLVKLNKNCQSVNGKIQIYESVAGDISLVLTNLKNTQQENITISDTEYFEFCVEAQTPYSLRIEKQDFFTQTLKFETNDDNNFQLDDIMLDKIVIDKAIQLENIYYDLGSANIRADAAKELDKLVTLLKDNPTIEIELGSHTDSRGSDVYNLNLSIKRANSARDYIISQSISAGRISAKGYGETELLNKCSNGVNCNAAEHQANRRTAFKVLKY